MNRAAKISFKNEIAGRLEETARGGTRFIYHENWQTPIGCSLPVRQREHEWNDGLHPFFQHLGAEGWLREYLADGPKSAADGTEAATAHGFTADQIRRARTRVCATFQRLADDGERRWYWELANNDDESDP